MKNHVNIDHLAKYDAFRVNRDQVMDLETWPKIHTNVYNFEINAKYATCISVLVNWSVFWKIGLCFEKLFCVLVNWFVFWEIDLCFGKLICVLGNWFLFWETVLCFGKLICVWPFWATVVRGHWPACWRGRQFQNVFLTLRLCSALSRSEVWPILYFIDVTWVKQINQDRAKFHFFLCW